MYGKLTRPIFSLECPYQFYSDGKPAKLKEWFYQTVPGYDLILSFHRPNTYVLDCFGPVNKEFPLDKVKRVVIQYLSKNKLIK